ncbi:hypothetical protein BCR44DRAFT_51186 [Catenaria anguillulae PL171]|uniref:Homeobox domain-containing protein n=1 Tax=Catenaria anguillulae PL171 TaxID=765915 RepID=A0A1Y2I352_9FUNG|nr:hypothetical protein BCR44DRAFT_51186 [Catenaria anguillulae PL171]
MSARPTRRAARAVSTYAESPTRSTFPPSAAAETSNTPTDAQDVSASNPSASETPVARSDRNPTLSGATQSRGTGSTRGGRGSRGGKRGGGRGQLTSPNKGNRNPKLQSDHEHESDGVVVAQETSSAGAIAAAGTSISLQDPPPPRSSTSAAAGIPNGQTGQALVSHVQYCLKIMGEFIDHDDSDHPGTAYGPAVDSIAQVVDELLHKCKRPARFNRAPDGGATMVDQSVQADDDTPASVLQALSVIVPPPTLAFASQLTSPPPPGSALANMVLDAQAKAAKIALASQCAIGVGVSASCSCTCHATSSSSSSSSSTLAAVGHSTALGRPQAATAPLPPTAVLDTSILVNTNSNATRGLTTQNGMQDLQGADLVRAGNEAQQHHRFDQSSSHSCSRQAEQHLEASQAPLTRLCHVADHYGDAPIDASACLMSTAADTTTTRSSAAHRLSGIRTANAESAAAAQLAVGSFASKTFPLAQLQDQHTPSIRNDTSSPCRDDSPVQHSGHVDSPSIAGGAVARAVDQRLGSPNDEYTTDHSHRFIGNQQDVTDGHFDSAGRGDSSESTSAVDFLSPAPTGAGAINHQQYATDQEEPMEPPRKRARTSQDGGGTYQQQQQQQQASYLTGPDRPDPDIVRSWASLSSALNPTDPGLIPVPLPWQGTPSAAGTIDSSSAQCDVQRAMNSAATNALASASSSSTSPAVGMPASGSDQRRDSVELTMEGMSPGPDEDDGYDFSMFGPDFTEHGSPNPSQYNPDGGVVPMHIPGALDNGRVMRRRLAQYKMSALKASYAKSPYPDRMERARLCRELGIEDKTITIWFNNQRKMHRERLRRAGFNAHGRSELPALPSHRQTLPRFHSFVGTPLNPPAAAATDQSHSFDDQSDVLSSVTSSALDGSSQSPQVDHSHSQRLPNWHQFGAAAHPFSLTAPVVSSDSRYLGGVGSDMSHDASDEAGPFGPALVSPAQSDISQSSHRSRQASDRVLPLPSVPSPIPSSQAYISVVNTTPSTSLAQDTFVAARPFPSPLVGQERGQISSYAGPVAAATSAVTSSYYPGPPLQHMQQHHHFNNQTSQQPQPTFTANGPGYGESPSLQSPFSPAFATHTFHEQGFSQEGAAADLTSVSASTSTPPTPAATPAPRSRRRSRNTSNLSSHSANGVSSDTQQAVPSTSPPPSTNIRGRWTSAELEALRLAVLRYGRDWAAIHAAHGPQGTVDQSLGRLPSVRALRQKAYRLGLHSGSADAWLNEPFSEE